MKLSIAIAVLCAASLCAQPQGPGGPGLQAPSVDAVKAFLTLTDAQVTTLEQIRKSEDDASQTVRQDLDAKRQALQQLIGGGSTDASAIGSLTLQIAALRKQLDQNHANYQAQAVQSLSADQKAKLKALDDAAKLLAAVRQAAMLELLTPPVPSGPNGGPGPDGPPHP